MGARRSLAISALAGSELGESFTRFGPAGLATATTYVLVAAALVHVPLAGVITEYDLAP